VAEAISHMFGQSYAWFLAITEGLEPGPALSRYIDVYLSRKHRDQRASGCVLAALSGDLPRMSEAVRARFTEGAERLPAAIAALLRRLGRANAEALALSAVSEMAGALVLARAVSDPERSHRILRNAREMVKARLGLETER
jgi:TetR/AcrR family transcriptional regulator, transcriptional repressor for nem operon